MKRLAIMRLFTGVLMCIALNSFAATAQEKTVAWALPEGWEQGVTYDVCSDGYVDIYGGELSRRYGLGGVGEPDLPTLTVNVGIPDGGAFVSATLDAVEWAPVEVNGAIPIPIAEPVQYGAELVYPTPEKGAYEGVYPSEFVVAGRPGVSGGVTMVPITVTPYKWDGTTKTLYKAASLKVKITLQVKKTLRLSTSSSGGRGATRPTNPNTAKQRAMARTINPDDLESAGALRLSTSSVNDGSNKEIIIISPSEFVPLWEGYAAFRKNTEAGKDFTYTIVNTADIYKDSKYWTAQCEATKNVARSDNADALAIHHYLEEHYDANKEQYIILGAAPTKYQYDRATMIPARYVVNQNSYDQVCDMYYGCMDRKDETGKVIPLEEAKKMDEPPEVWDYNHDGWYMGSKNAGGGYTGDEDARVDWDMDVPVTRVPLMREVAETKDGKVYHMNAAQIMDNFTNRIAFAENPATWTSDKSWRHVLGGGYLFNSYARGSKNYLVRGERQFFDGGTNHFDENHTSPSPDAEACPRSRNFEQFSCYRAARHGLINTGGLVTCPWSELYTNFGDCFEVDCHGWARGADPGTTGGALFSTGLWRVYNMALPCESGMYDYCPNGSYGITNCVSMGEAPLLCFGTDPNNPKNVGGGLVTFNNSRYGWWGGYNNMSSAMERLINWAFYQYDMNAGQACVWMHNNSGMKTTKSRGGATNIEVIMHGDPLIKISPQLDRSLTADDTEWNTNTVDYTKNLYVDVTDEGDVTFDVTGDDLAAARLKMVGNAGQTITLSGTNGLFRTTDATVVTNANLTWNVAGGAGRNGIEFVGEGCNLTFEGKAKRYVGYKVLNAASVNVTGGNVTFDFDDDKAEGSVFTVGRLAFGGSAFDTSAYNVIRTRKEGFFSPSRTIGIKNNCVELQTWNIGGGTTANKDAPLFFLTNSYLKVTYNPYWETEYFVRPTHLTDSRIVGEYEKFGFGRPEGYGYDLYVWGTSYIEGTKPIMLNGELRVHLMNGATLEIANPMSDGHGGMAGSIRVMGAGTMRITGEQTFTGGITVESGTKLEFTIAKAVKCDVTVEKGGEMKLGIIPLEGVKTITMRSGSKLVLPFATGAGVYQIIDSSTSSIVLETGAQVYDAADLTTPLEGKLSEGYFLLTANLIDWQGTSGTWKNDAGLTENWLDAKGHPIGFTNTMPVVFGKVGEGVKVTVEGEVKPGFINFDNEGVRYSFVQPSTSTSTSLISIESLASSYDVTFGVNLALGNVLKVLGGSFTATNVESSQIDVSGGALHVTGAITEPKKKVRTIKFEFASAQRDGEKTAIQELRLFRGESSFVKLPVGTIIEDIAGQKIRIVAGGSTWSHAYEWVSPQPDNEDESLKALIDGVIGGNNKWWASKNSAPTWFTITFPEPQELVTGYAIEAADANYRNPKTWRVYTSPGTDNLTLAGGKDGYTCDLARKWMGPDGKVSSGEKADFEIQSVNGALVIHDKGALVADGECRMNLKFEVGATLAVTNTCALSNAVQTAALTLPEEDGSVLVDASRADETDQAFPILTGYELTPEQFRKFRCESDTAVINLKDGDLYVVTDGIRKAPYTAKVSDWADALTWSGLDWVDGNTNHFEWTDAINYRTDGNATINLDWVDGKATTLNLDVGGALGSLTLGGRATDAITLSWGAALVPRTLDFRPYAGPVTLDYGTGSEYALGYADFYAGRDTEIPSASGGTLVIGAGKRAVIPGWGDFAKITGDGTVAIKLAAKGEEISPTWGNEVGGGATTHTNILELLRGTWKIENANDYPKTKEVIVGADGVLSFSEVVDTSGYRVCPTGLTVENGGEVHFGKRDTFNRKLTLRNGGKVLMTADATDSNRALDIYEKATIVAEGDAPSLFGGTEAEIDGETGDPIVKSGIIALRRPDGLTVTVVEGATLRMFSQWGGAAGMTYPWAKNGAGLLEFYRPSEQTGNMTIEEGMVRLVNKGQGTKGAIINNAELQVCASNGYVQTVANVIQGMGGVTKLGPGTTVLTGVNTYRGDTTVEEGTLKIGNAEALGASSVWMVGGTLDMGTLRMPDYTVNATREAALLAAFKIRAELTTAESYGQVQLVKLGAFAEYLTSGELKQLFTIVVNGVELKPEEFKIVVSGGIAEYQPDQLEGYNYPLETTVSTSNDWAAFEWRDQSGVAFTNDWADYPNATVVVNVEPGKSGQMTFAHSVTTPRLTINNKGGYLEIGGGAATLHPAGMVDATGCEEGSVTFLNFDLGACNIDTGYGEVILLPGCSGTLNTDPGSIVTVTNGTGKGTAVLAAGSELRFLGTTPMNNLLWCSVDNRSGAWIGYGFPITIDEAAFGGVGDNPGRTDGNFHFQGNLQMVTKRFVAGNGTGTVENFKQTGGSIDVTGSGSGETTTTSTVLLGHWPSTITWEQSGGTFTATNAPTILGWDGKVAWTMMGGTTRLRGLWAKRVSTHDNTSSFTLAGGRLEIGDLGIIFKDRGNKNASLTLAGGTLSAYTNATVEVEKGIVVADNSVISAETNALLTVDATITGEGVLTAEGDGVVRYVGDCSAAKLAGKFEIMVTEAQRQGTTSSVLFTLPDGVTVPNVRIVDVNGEPAEGGNGKAANGKYHWVPSGTYVQPITTTLNGGEVKSYETKWYDAAGTEIAFKDLTTAMDLVAQVTADTTLVSYDTKAFGKMTFTGGHKLTLKSVVLTSTTVNNAEVLTDVVLADSSFTLSKVTALSEGATLTIGAATCVGSFGDGPFAGTLVCDGFDPGNTWSVFRESARWQGVLKVTANVEMKDKALGVYGNSRSTFDIVGAWSGYLPKAGSTDVNIKLSNTFALTNGYSTSGGYKFNGALSGAGKLQTSGGQKDVIAFMGDASQFRGTVDVKGGHCVSFGDQEDDDTCIGMIAVLSTTPIIASNVTWSAQNGIVVKENGVLSVEYRSDGSAASSSAVTVNEGGTLNLVRTDDSQREFKVSNTALTLNGTLTLNGVPVPSWGFEQNAGTITLKEKAVCILPVKANVEGRQSLTDLAFTDSAETPNTFTTDELQAVSDLEIDFTMAENAELVVDNTLGARVFRFLGDGASSVIGSTGSVTVYAGTDTTFDTAGAGMLVIESGMKATVPSWPANKVLLLPGGWLKLTGSGEMPLPSYTVANATLELAGEYELSGDKNRAAADSTLVSSGTLTTGDFENGMKPGSTLNVTAGTMTLNHRFIMSQGSAGVAYLNQTGGEITSGETSGNLYVGGYDNSRMVVSITGGRFSAAYAPYVENGVTKCYGTTTVSGKGVFAPRIITLCDVDNNKKSCTLRDVEDVTVSAYNHNLYLVDGGTFAPPAIIPNWFATSVTNGTGKIGVGEGVGVALAKGPITIATDCVLDVTDGTLKLANTPQGEGTLNISESAALDLNGHSVYNVTGSGAVTDSSAAMANVIYNTTFNTNLTFNCNVKLENPYVDVAEACEEITLITKGTGVIASMDGVRVRVNGKLDRRTWKLTADRRGIELSVPYSAFLTKTTNWNEGKGEGLEGHGKFQNDKNYSIVISNSADNATLTFDTDSKASVFKVVSDFGKVATIDKTDVSLDFDSYDFSEAHGRTTLAYNPGGLSVTAGTDTHLPKGGNGKLTIPSGATAVVGAEFANYANEGTLRRDYDCGERDYGTILKGTTSSTNSFKSVTFTGGMQAAKVVIQTLDGDRVTLKGASGNYGARTQSSFDVRGGTLRIESNASDTWYGANGTTAFRQSGGVFEVTANNQSQNGNVGFMFGYANTSASYIPFDISGGHFLVENTSINFYDPSVVTLGGTGLIRAKGVFKAKSDATMTIANEARFELGSLGWRANSAALTMTGGTLTTFGNATMENAITLGGDATIGAAADTTLTLNATVSGAHALTIGAVASNDTGKVVAAGSRFACGKLVLAAGTLEIPVTDPLTNDVELTGGKLNLTGLEGAIAYVITTGSLSGATDDNITFNGLSLAEANLKREGNVLLPTVAVQPFHLDIPSTPTTYTSSWTNAPWLGVNNVAVMPDQWSFVCVANVTVAEGVTAALTVDSPITVEILNIANKGSLNIGLAHPDFEIKKVENLHCQPQPQTSTYFTVIGQDGAAWPVLKFGFGTNRLDIACGTRMSPFTIDTKEKLLESRDIRIADGAALRLHELSTGSGNSVWTIAGEGWDQSTLILSVERGLGFNAGSNFTNLTLIVDAAVADKKVYFEQRSEREVLTDSTVDLVITNNSIAVVQGSSTFGNTLNIGNLSGDGTISGGSYNNATLGVNLHSDSTFDGVCKIPMIVSGDGHTLTLTAVNTGAITVTNGATVKLALDESATHTAALSGDGTVEVASGTLRTAGDIPCKLVVDAEGKIDIAHELENEFTLSTQGIAFGEGASVTNNVMANGVPLQGVWTIEDGTIRRTGPTTPFAVAPAADSDWTASPWVGENGVAVVPNDWRNTIAAAEVTVDAGTNVTLSLDRDIAITSFEVTGEGELTIDKEDFVFSPSSTVITNGATLALSGCAANTINGNGTLALRAVDRDTEVQVSGAFDTTKFTGPICLDCGTWNITGNYPKWFSLSAVGENAVLRFNGGDITGYEDKNFPDLLIADGATLRISKRDTFNRKLVLKDGAKMALDGDDLGGGRSFDFFTKSSLDVRGGGVSAIGSGVVALRRKNFTLTVDEGSALQCYAKWIAGDGSGESFIKTGSGLMEQFRETSVALPFALNGGMLRLVNEGRVTTGAMTLASGTILELNASEDGNFALDNRLSGEGGLVKLGPGTFTLAGETDFTGATVVSNGMLVVRAGQLVGDVALASAEATLDVMGPEGQPEYDITQGAFAPGEGRVLLNGAELAPHYAVDGNKIVAVHQPATVYALPDVTVVSNGMDVLTAKGGVETTKLGIGDTLVICDAHAEDAQAIRFNQTVFLEEIRFDANGVVKVQNSDLPGEYVFDGANVSVTSGTLTLFAGNHGDPKVKDTVFTIADGAKLTNWGWPGIYGTVTIDAAGDTTAFDGNNPTLSGDGRLVKKGSGRLTMAAKPQGQSFTIDEGTLTLTRADGSTGAITGTGTLELGPDATVVPSTIADSITLAGTGTFVYDNAWPDATVRTKLQADAWHGTVWIKNALIHDTNKLRECGNAHSKIKVTGVMGYMPSSAGGDQGVAELVLADDSTTGKLALEIDDSSKTYVYGYAKFSGDGTFKFATKASSTCAVTIADVSAFTGRLLSTAGKHHSGSPATTARPIFVGGTGVASTKSLISVADGMTIHAGCGWEAAEVAFGRTLVVKGAVGDVLVTNVTTEATLDTTVYLKDPSTGANIPGYYKLAYDAENKLVKVVASEGTILTWNGSGWEDAQHQMVEESEITTDHILCATADDVITFASAVTPKSFLMPTSGRVTVNGYHNLGVPDVNIMAQATLKVVFPDEVTAITNVFTGAGTLELALAGTEKYVTSMPVADANFSDLFTGTLKLSAGQFKATAAIKKSVSIAVVQGAQLFAASDSGAWNNRFHISGNGWGRNDNLVDKAALRVESSIGASAMIEFETVNDIVPTIGCYSGTKNIAGVLVGTNGFREVGTGTLKFTAPKMQAADLHGKVIVESGDLFLGSNSGFAAGESVVFGEEIEVGSGRKLTIHAWSGKDESLTEPGNHVYIAPAITLNGGTLYFEDGSYILSGDLTVAADSTMSVMYDKGRIIKSLKGGEDVTLTIVNRTGSYANDGLIAVKGGDFQGTIADSSTGRTFKFVPVGEALANATVKFTGKGLLRPQGDATIGTLDCATQISGSGTLAVNDGQFTSTLQGVSLNILRGMLNFVPAAEMPTNTITTGSVTVPAGQTLRDVLLFNGETLDGSWQISEDNATIYRYVYETISVNFAGGNNSSGESPANYLVTGSAAVGLVAVPGYAWNNVNGRWKGRTTKTLGAGTVNAYNGTTNVVLANVAVSCAADNTYLWDAAQTVFFKGYLDDGNRANVTVTGLAYERYDVIIYATADTANYKLSPIKVNGKEYTYVDGGVEEGSSTWGATRASIPAYGQNALRVRNLTGETLTIVGGANANTARGGIAAIQIINTTRAPVDPVYYFATIAGSTNFADIAWTPTPFVENEYNVATLTVDDSSTDEVVLTFDSPDLTLDTFDIVSPRNVWLDSLAHLANVRDLVTTNVAGLVIYGWPTTVLNSGDANVAYGGGAGSAEAPLAIGHNGGALNLRGGTYYLTESTSGTATTVNVTDSVLDYGASRLGVGMATYDIGGTSSVVTTTFVLSQGQAGRSAVFSLGGKASVKVSGTTSGDNNQSSVMFGHWNGPSTFTLEDEATFTAASDVLVGLTGNTQTININGGVFTARGIKASKNASGTNTLNLNGGELVLGETGITSYGTTKIAVNVTGDAKITATAALSITQPMMVAADAILTLDATAGDITFMPSAGMMPDRVTVLGGNVYYGFTVDINSCGMFKLTEGLTPDNVKLYDVNGKPVTFAYNEQKGALEFAWEIEGESCWWDYEFNGNVTSVGTDTTTMDKEGTEPYYNAASNALWVGHATHYRGASYPEEFTAVLCGKMVNTQGHLEIGFGSTTGGTKVNVSIACGDPAKEEVKLLVSEGYTVKKTVLMKVPNAYTANHLYAFVYRTVAENNVEKSKVIVYLDGVEWDSFTFDGKVTLGGGFQIGSVHGGAPTGYAKATTVNANSFLDFLRVYKTVLNPAAMAKYAAKYPYVSTNGRAERTLDAEVATWTAEDAWTVWPAEGESFASNQPPVKAMVAMDASVASTVTFDLDEAATYEQLDISGEYPVTLKTGGVKPSVVGLTTIDANVTNDWDAIGYGNVMVKEGKSLTFDFTNYPFTNCFASTTINLTGKPSGTGTFAAIIPKQYAGRTAEFRTNPDTGHYELVITVTHQPFIYTIAEGGTGTWTWGTEQPVTEAVVDANPTIPIQKNGAGTLTKAINRVYIVNAGTLKAASVADAGRVTINTDGTFDINGKGEGNFQVILKGGAFVNNGNNLGDGTKQLQRLTVADADSSIGGSGNFGLIAGGWAANILDLGGQMLTKNGAAQFWLANTTVTNGTIRIAGGQLTVTQRDVAFVSGAYLTIGSAGTLCINGKELVIDAITGEAGATINNAGTISGFTLSGEAKLAGNGAYGTITNAVGAVADIGQRLGYFTFAGEGSVNAQLTGDWKPGDSVTIFKVAEGATTTVNTLKDKDGTVIDPSRYTCENGVVTFRQKPKKGMMIFVK